MDTKIADYIKEVFVDINDELMVLYQSSHYRDMYNYYEELNHARETDEIIKEMNRVDASISLLMDNTIKNCLKKISFDDKKMIIENMSINLIKENHLDKIYHFDLFIKNILDLCYRDSEKCNNLWKNDNFIRAIWVSPVILEYLGEHSNSEENFTYFVDCFIKYLNDNISSNLGLVLGTMARGDNYSPPFIMNLLKREDVYNCIDEYYLPEILSSLRLPKDEKLAFIMSDEIFLKISPPFFSSTIASLCQSYDDAILAINDSKIAEKLLLGVFLRCLKISLEDYQKLLFNEQIINNLNNKDVVLIISRTLYSFELKRRLLLDKVVISKLSLDDVFAMMTSYILTSDEKNELCSLVINDSLINKAKISFNNDTLCDFFKNNTPKYVNITDKLLILRNKKLLPYIDDKMVENVLSDESLSLSEAYDIFFDRDMFYYLLTKLSSKKVKNLKKWLDDKYEYAQKLYKWDPYIVKKTSYKLFDDKILMLGEDVVKRISPYRDLIHDLYDKLHDANDTTFLYINKMFDTIKNSKYASKLDVFSFLIRIINTCSDKTFLEMYQSSELNPYEFSLEDFKIITLITLRNNSIYYKDIKRDFFGKTTKKALDKSLNITPCIKTINDLKNYYQNYMTLCDQLFNEAFKNNNLRMAQNAYFNKYFNINIEEAAIIFDLYGYSLAEFKQNPSFKKQVSYLSKIEEILNEKDIKIVASDYNSSNLKPFDFDQTIYIDNELKQMFAKDINDNLYKVSSKIMDEDNKWNDNSFKYIDILLEEGLRHVLVYEPGFSFKMLIHSMGAYNKLEFINDNYYDTWYLNKRLTNHGISASLISNDNLGLSVVRDVLLGFDHFRLSSLKALAPYDIYSYSNNYDIEEGSRMKFMSIQDIIDNTHDFYNELVIERYDDKLSLSPSYVVIYSNMSPKLKSKSIKCSQDMNIPIVYLDIEKIIVYEVSKIDKIIENINNTHDLDKKIALFTKALILHENNRNGLQENKKAYLDKSFPSSKIEKVLNKIIDDIQRQYEQTNDLAKYQKQCCNLINVLNRELAKFKISETYINPKYYDIKLHDYIDMITQKL